MLLLLLLLELEDLGDLHVEDEEDADIVETNHIVDLARVDELGEVNVHLLQQLVFGTLILSNVYFNDDLLPGELPIGPLGHRKSPSEALLSEGHITVIRGRSSGSKPSQVADGSLPVLVGRIDRAGQDPVVSGFLIFSGTVSELDVCHLRLQLALEAQEARRETVLAVYQIQIYLWRDRCLLLRHLEKRLLLRGHHPWLRLLLLKSWQARNLLGLVKIWARQGYVG